VKANKSPLRKYQWLVVAILALTQFTVVLDFMVMSPLGDLLIKDLQVKPYQFGIVVSSYALAAGISGFLTAGFADRFDRKRLLGWSFYMHVTTYSSWPEACSRPPRSTNGAFAVSPFISNHQKPQLPHRFYGNRIHVARRLLDDALGQCICRQQRWDFSSTTPLAFHGGGYFNLSHHATHWPARTHRS